MVQTIIPAYDPVMKILGPNTADDGLCRPSVFTCSAEAGEMVVCYNTLTRELIAYPKKEEESDEVKEYLRRGWYRIPGQKNEIREADRVRALLSIAARRKHTPTAYTIFTTTRCNARCFYCYEKGRRQADMSMETADGAAAYILRNSSGSTAKLNWFGGEPLFHEAAISRICSRLREAGQEYKSSMISNGYLFREENVRKASELWNLRDVQITLDGTEDVYNKAKRYIYSTGSPYRVVMDNIRRLLKAQIQVSIRLNLDLYNAEDLLRLADELKQTFSGEKHLKVYCSIIFEENQPEEVVKRRRTEIYSLRRNLRERLVNDGLMPMPRMKHELPLNQCMADSGESVTILPDGRTGLCQHYSDSEAAGSVWNDQMDTSVIESWKKIREPIPACAGCVMYPECYFLRKCPDMPECFPELREDRISWMKEVMKNEYDVWLRFGGSKPLADPGSSGYGDSDGAGNAGEEYC